MGPLYLAYISIFRKYAVYGSGNCTTHFLALEESLQCDSCETETAQTGTSMIFFPSKSESSFVPLMTTNCLAHI